MRDAAEEVNVKYSTAKTILQVFRREHRIAKKEKEKIMSKMALRHERRLIRVLSRVRVYKIMKKIMMTEIRKRNKAKIEKTEGLREPATATVLPKDHANTRNKGELPRVISANQMVIFPAEESGPGANQVSRAVSTKTFKYFLKRDIFKVVKIENLEEEYKRIMNCNKPIKTKGESFLKLISLTTHKPPPINDEPKEIVSGTFFHVKIANGPQIAFSFAEYSNEIFRSYSVR